MKFSKEVNVPLSFLSAMIILEITSSPLIPFNPKRIAVPFSFNEKNSSDSFTDGAKIWIPLLVQNAKYIFNLFGLLI